MIKPKWILQRIHNLPQCFIYVGGIASGLLIKIFWISGLNRNFIGT